MKTELRAKPHSLTPGAFVIEIWHAGKLLGTIAGADGPGVRIISKHSIEATRAPDDGSGVGVVEVRIVAASPENN